VAGAGISGLFDVKGNKIAERSPTCNMGIFWDGDALSEILSGTSVSKWDYENNRQLTLLDTRSYDCVQNNGSKANPCLSVDLWGDWREELIYRTRDSKELRIFTSTIPTNLKLNCLLQDVQYRLSIAWQNVAYNQPPHTSFFMGDGMQLPKLPLNTETNSDTKKSIR
jgi:rhamnogalacturonan endolyase